MITIIRLIICSGTVMILTMQAIRLLDGETAIIIMEPAGLVLSMKVILRLRRILHREPG